MKNNKVFNNMNSSILKFIEKSQYTAFSNYSYIARKNKEKIFI